MVEIMNCIYRYKTIFFAESNKNVKIGACQRKVNNNKKLSFKCNHFLTSK